MKKILFTSLITIFLSIFIGCKQVEPVLPEENPGPTQPTADQPPATPPEEPQNRIETITEDYRIIINEYDSNDFKIKATYYDLDENLLFYYVYENDSNGNHIKESCYESEEILSYWNIFDYNDSGDKIKETRYRIDGSVYYIFDYDANGNKIKESAYHSNGEIAVYRIFEYSNKKCISYKEYDPDELLHIEYAAEEGNYIDDIEFYEWNLIKYTYQLREYDKNDNNIKCIGYDLDGNIEGYFIAEFDVNGKKTSHINYNGDGSIYSYSTYEYDSNGHEIKRTSHNADGSIRESITREYNNDGNKIKETILSENGSSEVSEFDNDENLIKETYYRYDGSVASESEYNENGFIVVKYDCDGKKTFVIEYNINGEPTKQTDYYYYEDGTIDYIEERDSEWRIIKYTEYNADDSIRLKYEASEGNFIEIYRDDATGEVWFINEIDSDWNILKRTTYYYNDDGTYYSRDFNINGKEIKRTYYDSDGNISYYLTYEYNSNGNKIKYKEYNADNSVLFEYEAVEGNYIDIITNNNGIAYISEYNNEKILKETFYNQDKNVTKYSMYDYDENQNVRKYTEYNANDSILFEYEAPEGNYIDVFITNGYVSSILELTGNRMKIKHTTYDADGNIIEEITF